MYVGARSKRFHFSLFFSCPCPSPSFELTPTFYFFSQAAGKDQGLPDIGKMVRRTVTLANMPGDVGDIALILIREFFGDAVADAFGRPHPPREKFRGFCSMIAAWGSRTQNGHVYAGRNLDWNKDTGINKYKLVTVINPTDGAYPHATVGFPPVWGALAGMSSQGLTVHEANLEENQITFDGLPWLLRLRLVMETAKDLAVSLGVRGAGGGFVSGKNVKLLTLFIGPTICLHGKL